MNFIGGSYLDGRRELETRARNRIAAKALPEKAVEALFWGDHYADEKGIPRSLFDEALPEKQFNAVDFSPDAPPQVETIADWKRLRVTGNYCLPLQDFPSEEAYFQSLSGKTRKKLRWIRNSMPKMNCRIEPLVPDAAFADFKRLYAAQFPRYPENAPIHDGVYELYRMMEEEKRNFSRILYDPQGRALAACLAYRNGASVYYTHLTRVKGGEFDKYSPGVYLTYMLISELLREHPDIKIFFMGPGYYDYKTALGGRAFPVFRYVKKTWKNLFALIRLYHRAKQEKRRARQ